MQQNNQITFNKRIVLKFYTNYSDVIIL